jgi:phage shock protein PspC (stress-responsive transcriptional regulator)/anti-sigma regulatory factor (Ser/Thr protein kinase)
METTAQPIREPRRAFRDPGNRMLGGVASGVASHLGVDVGLTRIAFVILAILGGFGVIVYGALWVLLPVRGAEPQTPGLDAATRLGMRTEPSNRRRDVSIALSLLLIGVGGVVLLQNAGLWINSKVFWPLAVAGAGVALVWWQSDDPDRSAWLSDRGWKVWLRIAAGIFLVGVALWLTLFQAGVDRALDDAIGAILLAIAGFALVIGPWLLGLTRDLRLERQERIRNQERADVAAHLHDSVLQTLALIQRQASDPAVVTQLARTQERELRTWLFDDTDPESATLKASLQRAVAEVESSHRVQVELVVVGDAPASDSIAALVAASREAMVNAAKHSGAARIDVFAEVEAQQVEVDVRDRGSGFDLDDVAVDRQGVRGSIYERMNRHGGRAEIKTSPGEGTEVRMWVPSTPDQQGDVS